MSEDCCWNDIREFCKGVETCICSCHQKEIGWACKDCGKPALVRLWSGYGTIYSELCNTCLGYRVNDMSVGDTYTLRRLESKTDARI